MSDHAWDMLGGTAVFISYFIFLAIIMRRK